ncbi:DNA methyltransferase [Nocardioides phosphati]|uniref:DNA methyltransferase n=1 Tax=Nocardioides phosphati TaxID=1867775 RepID=A0ABQ2N985_9ACTN|nr:DNA adenine methylase [Nocardioides phosphati]GGO86694.1 DNA methyltransferase [Nocardioides phosphati]
MDRQTVKPPFAYYGGKMALAERIASLLPDHQHYVEPFAGSLAVLLAKAPSRAETVNDLDGSLITFWRVLRDHPESLARAAELTPHSRQEFAESWGDDHVGDEIEQARRVWVRLTQSRGHSLAKTGWKFSRRIDVGHASQRVTSFADRMPDAARRLRGVSLENRDALDVIRDYGTEPTVCIYADPPYVGSTRAANYGVEMAADEQHMDFAQVCHDSRAPVVISGYNSPLYDDLFADWHRVEIKGATTLSGDTDRVEVLWSNRPIGEPDLFGSTS